MPKKKESAIKKQILELDAEFKRMFNLTGGRQCLDFWPQPYLNEILYLESLIREKYGLKGKVQILAIAARLLRERIEQE